MRCTGIGTGYCRAIALRVSYGPYTTPYARIMKELLISWCRVYNVNMCEIPIDRISKAWHIAYNKIENCLTHTSNIKGIMTNMRHMLLTLKCNPIHFNEWIDPRGDKWKLSLNGSPRELIRNLIRDFKFKELKRASN